MGPRETALIHFTHAALSLGPSVTRLVGSSVTSSPRTLGPRGLRREWNGETMSGGARKERGKEP